MREINCKKARSGTECCARYLALNYESNEVESGFLPFTLPGHISCEVVNEVSSRTTHVTRIEFRVKHKTVT
jgi:hypothetical protein